MKNKVFIPSDYQIKVWSNYNATISECNNAIWDIRYKNMMPITYNLITASTSAIRGN